jgi:hypothetical protein
MVKEIKKLSDVGTDWDWYTKRPIPIKAAELTEEVEIHTREGILRAYSGDFILQGVQGEIYPCGREIFFKTYKRKNTKTKEGDSSQH